MTKDNAEHELDDELKSQGLGETGFQWLARGGRGQLTLRPKHFFWQ